MEQGELRAAGDGVGVQCPVDEVRGCVDGQGGEELEGAVDEVVEGCGGVVDYGWVWGEAGDYGVEGAVDWEGGGGDG